MGGYQFIHIEMYSRAGREGRGTTWVFDEAARHSDSCQHVSMPAPPQTVFGMNIEAVRTEHDRRASEAKTAIKTGHVRSIRKDQNTLMTVVASHPATMNEQSPGTNQVVADWERKTVAWLQEQFGETLVSIVRHVDEGHPHLHGFILPDDSEMRAARLHPGAKAKADAMALRAPDEDRMNANKRGDVAYRQAMRAWQTAYWQAVGLPCGLSRIGPGRRRLTRSAWKAEQTAQAAVAVASQRAAVVLGDARKKVKAAKAEVSAAEQKAEETIVNAEVLITRAHAVANDIIKKARTEATNIQDHWRHFSGFGGWVRALFDGLRRSQIREALESQINASTAERVSAITAARDRAIEQARTERDQRRKTETVLGRLQARLEEVLIERDRLRAVLSRYRRTETSPRMNPKPRL